mmetsp:Transcript_70228/g.139074  ORF Transcript_70228/g.139074 Transcript_70228/m.139074 type:complete len:236 (+) Transcript_70228:417-1124(+)
MLERAAPPACSRSWIRAIGATSLTLCGTVMPYCMPKTCGSQAIGAPPISGGLYGFRLPKSTPSMSSVAVDRSAMSSAHTVQALQTLIWSFLRPSTRSVLSRVMPEPFVSKTLKRTEFSPKNRNLQSQAVSESTVGELPDSQSTSKSSAALSTSTLPSTVKDNKWLCCNTAISATSLACFSPPVSTPAALLICWIPCDASFFSKTMWCSAKGPIMSFHIICVVELVHSTIVGSAVR